MSHWWSRRRSSSGSRHGRSGQGDPVRLPRGGSLARFPDRHGILAIGARAQARIRARGSCIPRCRGDHDRKPGAGRAPVREGVGCGPSRANPERRRTGWVRRRTGTCSRQASARVGGRVHARLRRHRRARARHRDAPRRSPTCRRYGEDPDRRGRSREARAGAPGARDGPSERPLPSFNAEDGSSVAPRGCRRRAGAPSQRPAVRGFAADQAPRGDGRRTSGDRRSRWPHGADRSRTRAGAMLAPAEGSSEPCRCHRCMPAEIPTESNAVRRAAYMSGSTTGATPSWTARGDLRRRCAGLVSGQPRTDANGPKKDPQIQQRRPLVKVRGVKAKLRGEDFVTVSALGVRADKSQGFVVEHELGKPGDARSMREKTRRWRGLDRSTKRGCSGRGPTRDISPRTTLTSWGSSSIRY